MTAPMPPTSGGMDGTAAEKYAAQDPGQSPEIQADLPDLSAMAAAAESAGKAWQAGAADWADSPQGDGLEGYTLSGDHPSGADGDWPSDMSFPHQGP
jgi:hypothetical protein